MELAVITIVIMFWLMPFSLRLMIEAVTTIMMFVLELRVRRNERAMFAMRYQHQDTLNFDQKSSLAEQRLMAIGLRLSLRQTSATSLFPTVSNRARRIVAAFDR